MATEGGHADFAPRNEQEIELLRYLHKQFGNHISNERVLSGPGIYNIYCFLRDTAFAPQPQWLTEALNAGGDHSATISEAGLAGKSPLCVETLRMFASIYGAEAGNLALRCMALAGVFVAGGIAPKLLPALRGACLHGKLRRQRPHARSAEGNRGQRGDESSHPLNRRRPLRAQYESVAPGNRAGCSSTPSRVRKNGF